MSLRFPISSVYAALLPLSAFFALAVLSAPAFAAGPDILQPANLAALGMAAPTADTAFIGSNQPLNVFYPGEPVSVTIRFAKGVTVPDSLTIGVVETGTRNDNYISAGITEMTPPPVYQNLGSDGNTVAAVKPDPATPAAPVGVTDFTVPVKIPDRFGTYVISIAPDGKNPQFLCTVARIHKPKDGFDPDVPIMADGGQMFGAMSSTPARMEAAATAYERLGFKFVRVEMGWRENADGTYDWTQDDKYMVPLAKHHIKLNITLGAHPQNFLPYGVTPSFNYVAAPEMDPKLQAWVTAFCKRYWNNGDGALTDLENWNEPWEPNGISGWGSDSRRYRQIQKAIADGARAVDPRIRIAAACSIMNTEDKFLTGDDAKEVIKYVDDFTDHYVTPRNAYGPMVAAYWGKQSYETETWGAATELLVPQFTAMFLADGQKRVSPFNANMSFITVPGNPDAYAMPNPIVVAANYVNTVIDDRPFVKMISLTHSPTAYQFGSGNDAVVLLINKLRNFGYGADVNDTKGFIWPQWQSDIAGTMTVDNHDGALHFFDVDGNPEFVGQKSVTIPLDLISHYITAPKGGADLIAARLDAARMDGALPVEIIAHDITGPGIRVTAHNLLNRPIAGTLTVTAPVNLPVGPNNLPVSLQAGESKDFVFPLDLSGRGSADAANAYLFKYTFTGEGRTVNLAETLSMTVGKRGTKVIDGSMDQWKDDLPVIVSSKFQAVDPTLRDWLPFENLKDQQADGSVGEVKMAYDDKNLYLCARVNSPNPPKPHVPRANWDEDQYFFGAKDDVLCEAFRPYRTLVETNMRDPKAVDAMKQNPQYAAFEQFLTDNPTEASYLKTNLQAIKAYFTAKDRDPKATLASFYYGYSHGFDAPYDGDRFQFAFDSHPGTYDANGMVLDLDRLPTGYHALPDTDYEFSVYPVPGGSETWRLLAPGVPRGHYFPHQARSKVDQGIVPGAQSIVKRDGNVTIYQVAIPWTEIGRIKPAAGTRFGFTFTLGSSSGPDIQYGIDKSACKYNGLTLHPYWANKPSASVIWALN